MFFYRYLNTNRENKKLYAKLKNVDESKLDMTCSDPGFETVSAAYLKVFDSIIATIEEKPGDVQSACDQLIAIGKMHRLKVPNMDSGKFRVMEEPFIFMVKEVLQDRFNEKAEGLFRTFFQFCLKYLTDGFNQ
ncbi:hypothetical protein DICVIV_00043 [Dictyocaulus viviparus]|uniref:Globin family profile domain-containing protein n=1 Tax=Dictyocaulus viviparus TaxID=29172 RepID=A0A0D8YA28_DICVI|nr:hypothetical protein DICVIV_00043 [Dictyocaulus viviparus]